MYAAIDKAVEANSGQQNGHLISEPKISGEETKEKNGSGSAPSSDGEGEFEGFNGFPVDPCFGQPLNHLLENHPFEHQLVVLPIGELDTAFQTPPGVATFRPPNADESYKSYYGLAAYDRDSALFTFEEFISSAALPQQCLPTNGPGEDGKPPNNGGFYNMALDDEDSQRHCNFTSMENANRLHNGGVVAPPKAPDGQQSIQHQMRAEAAGKSLPALIEQQPGNRSSLYMVAGNGIPTQPANQQPDAPLSTGSVAGHGGEKRRGKKGRSSPEVPTLSTSQSLGSVCKKDSITSSTGATGTSTQKRLQAEGGARTTHTVLSMARLLCCVRIAQRASTYAAPVGSHEDGAKDADLAVVYTRESKGSKQVHPSTAIRSASVAAQQHQKGTVGERDCQHEQQQAEARYSWDLRRELVNANDYRFAHKADEVLVKEPGDINGQQFCIEDCMDCMLLVLDHTASVTIDDCKNCIILLGPCAGSVFIRDSIHCTVYAICQQFRTRDASHCTLHLHSATAPTIEESAGLDFWPLWISYAEVEAHMFAAGISPFVNRWMDVHNFTPDTSGGHTVMGVADSATVGGTMWKKWEILLLRSPASLHALSLISEESYLVSACVKGIGQDYWQDAETILVVMKSFHKSHPLLLNELQFVREAMYALRRFLSLSADVRLANIKDVRLKAGELETLLHKKGGGKSCGGRLVCFEFLVPNGTALREEMGRLVEQQLKPGAAAKNQQRRDSKHREASQQLEQRPQTYVGAGTALRASVELIESGEKTKFYRTQLYRLFDIQQSV